MKIIAAGTKHSNQHVMPLDLDIKEERLCFKQLTLELPQYFSAWIH